MKLLEGKVVLVTGASRGIGRGHALTLADEGARVIVNGRAKEKVDSAVEVIRSRGGEAIANYEDISTWAGAKRSIEQAVDHYKTFDGLVNNAGVICNGDIPDATEEDFDYVMNVHVRGTFATMHHACAYWRNKHQAGERVRAAVVNTVSDALFLVLPKLPLYGAAKAAIAHFTLAGGLEGAQYGVRVNAVAPRAFTQMSVGASIMNYADNVVVKEAEEYTEDTPVNPSNSSPIVAWLLSEEAGHVTGQVFQTLAGAFARCEPWRPAEMNWPADGTMRFKPEDVGRVMNQRVYRSQIEGKPLEFAPGDPRSQKIK